jgi:hypothetical protein
LQHHNRISKYPPETASSMDIMEDEAKQNRALFLLTLTMHVDRLTTTHSDKRTHGTSK